MLLYGFVFHLGTFASGPEVCCQLFLLPRFGATVPGPESPSRSPARGRGRCPEAAAGVAAVTAATLCKSSLLTLSLENRQGGKSRQLNGHHGKGESDRPGTGWGRPVEGRVHRAAGAVVSSSLWNDRCWAPHLPPCPRLPLCPFFNPSLSPSCKPQPGIPVLQTLLRVCHFRGSA